MWPFRRKMTVDYLASLVADAIEEDIDVYKQALREHAAENITEDQIDCLYSEFWAIELTIVDLILSTLKLGSSAASLANLVPMLVVGYSPLEKESYISRARYYASSVAGVSSEKTTVSLSQAFVSNSGINYANERMNVNRQTLLWAIAAVATGSLESLGSLISDILEDYRIY